MRRSCHGRSTTMRGWTMPCRSLPTLFACPHDVDEVRTREVGTGQATAFHAYSAALRRENAVKIMHCLCLELYLRDRDRVFGEHCITTVRYTILVTIDVSENSDKRTISFAAPRETPTIAPCKFSHRIISIALLPSFFENPNPDFGLRFPFRYVARSVKCCSEGISVRFNHLAYNWEPISEFSFKSSSIC